MSISGERLNLFSLPSTGHNVSAGGWVSYEVGGDFNKTCTTLWWAT